MARLTALRSLRSQMMRRAMMLTRRRRAAGRACATNRWCRRSMQYCDAIDTHTLRRAHTHIQTANAWRAHKLCLLRCARFPSVPFSSLPFRRNLYLSCMLWAAQTYRFRKVEEGEFMLLCLSLVSCIKRHLITGPFVVIYFDLHWVPLTATQRNTPTNYICITCRQVHKAC